MTVSKRLNLARFFKGEGLESDTVTLSQRRIFILPTRAGISFMLILFAMFLAAINYNNSLAYLLTFLLTSIAIISMLHCHRNLQGLQLRTSTPQPSFAKQDVHFALHIHNPSHRAKLAIRLGWPKQPPLGCDLAINEGQWLTLHDKAIKRGWQPMQRITLYSRYPLGLFHAWSHIHFDQRVLIYPQPLTRQQLPQQRTLATGTDGSLGKGSDDFSGQRPYHPGDSLRHINWKALARERGVLTKQFSGNQADELMLDWSMVAGLELELKLSQLCQWVIQAHQSNLRYGLTLPDQQILASSGQAHYQQCLTALALYGERR